MSSQHVCMFIRADNEHGFIQCTIKPAYRRAFEDLGFVNDVSMLPDKPKRKRRTKEEMAADGDS